jgi:hypothetical protein
MPLEWGRPERVHELLGEAFDLEIEERLDLRGAERGGVLADVLPGFGPLKTLLEASDEDRREQIHRTFVDSFASMFGSADGTIRHPREYLLVTGTRR